uniref:Olfactory receptor, family 70, subfamily B, member 1 n=1 Tax=Oryzias sinensis TaxID=183150 RepID=A0A8C7YWG3_9TELE
MKARKRQTRSMENYTLNSYYLQLESLNVSEASKYPVFFLFLFIYLLIMLTNVGIIVLIIIDRNLHQPMYLLFCNLSVSDVIGSTYMIPRLLSDILKPPSERLISYYEYVAICNPLRYANIMTNRMVLKLTVFAWGSAFVLVGILLGLTIRLSRCRTLIENPFCDNASLFKLSCESVVINNIYGLTFTVVLFSSSIGSTVLTYTSISVVCLTSKNKSLNRKALKTCSTHLFVYMIMISCGLLNIVLHRFPDYSDQRKLIVILFHIIPGSLNPIIYGLQSKEVQRFFLSKGLCPQFDMAAMDSLFFSRFNK